MIKNKITIAGSGGQGALSMGQMIAYAGLKEGLEATWLPSYGAEMRGGTANCSVIISEVEIPYPIVTEPDYCIVMNLPSLLKFESIVRPGGILIINSSMIPEKATREDLSVFYVPADEIAEEEKNPRGANMVLLGVYITIAGSIKEESIAAIIDKTFTGSKARFAESNKQLVTRGIEYGKNI
ncbi:2-oxoacid:ferredoxin oxidoreductase subunit gamma [Clostridia bacterium]|nr:2-oxoacid:ferredoxin oxidoreductase subunit gamma [Clostridia bacterium]